MAMNGVSLRFLVQKEMSSGLQAGAKREGCCGEGSRDSTRQSRATRSEGSWVFIRALCARTKYSIISGRAGELRYD